MLVKSASDPQETEDDAELLLGKRRPIMVALGLAGMLLAIVLIINYLGAPQVAINAEVVPLLVEHEQIDWVSVDAEGRLLLQLKHMQVIEDRQQSVRTDRLYLGPADWTKAELQEWMAAGNFTDKPLADSQWDNQAWPGIVFIVAILGAGGYYLWRQAQWNRKYGSPREQIDVLAKKLEDGEITQEEYQEKLGAITPHL